MGDNSVYPLPLQGFKGLDLRMTAEGTQPTAFRVANNIDLTTGGSVKSRDQLRQVATVDSASLGLYVVGGKLRCAMPLTGGAIPNPPPGITYDYFANNAAGQTNGALALTGVQAWGGVSYLCVKRYVDISNPAYGFQYEHHYCPSKLVSDLPGTVTLVALPYAPGPQLYAMVRKLWSHDINTNDVWFSSSINGPTDWTNSGDAGYLPVSQQAFGDKVLQGFAQYNGQIALFFSDSVQLWDVFTDPADNDLSEIVGGVGTVNTRSIVDMGGVTTYFSNGGFRTLAAVAVTGEKNDSDIGANIYTETAKLDLTNKTPISLWCPTRSQMLCAIDNTVYVYTYSPKSNITGWTKYTLSINVTDLVVLNGITYMRSGTGIYQLDSNYVSELNFAWTLRFAYQHGSVWGNEKEWLALETASTGRMTTKYYVDPNDETKIYAGPIMTNSHYGRNRVPLGIVAPCIAPEYAGITPWSLDALSFLLRNGNT